MMYRGIYPMPPEMQGDAHSFMESGAQQPIRLKVVDPDEQPVAPYASFVFASSSDRDMRLIFAQAVPPVYAEDQTVAIEEIKARVVSQVLLSHQTARELLDVLTKQIQAIEANDRRLGLRKP